MSRLEISINQPEFLPVEIQILGALIDKHEQYTCQGRDLEARGVHRCITIMWETLKTGFCDTQPTMRADL